MEKVLVKFHKCTENRYDFLKLAAVNVNVRKCSCEYVFLYPAEKESIVQAERERIETDLLKLL